VEVRVLRAEAPALRDALARPEAGDQLERLLEGLELVGRLRPVEAEGRLVQGLSGADADEAAARIHGLERAEALRDEGRVVALEPDRDGGADRDALGRLGRGPEPDPCVAGLASFPPGLKVVAAADPVEAGALARDCLLEEVGRRELLVRAAEEVALFGHARSLPGRSEAKRRGRAPSERISDPLS
jgi:hypothetical protein